MELSKSDLVKKLWHLFDFQMWDQSLDLLHSDFKARWPQSREQMNAENFIEVNRNYPGQHKIEIVHLFEINDVVITTVWIQADTGQKTFANSIFRFKENRILSVEEYWAEPYPAPESRRKWVELY